jgi:hypothetical protein
MRNRNNRYFVGDFETTVYKGQVNTEVWASACVEMFTEDVHIFHSIGEQFDYFVSLDSHIICYYHNLKFDGSFWLSYLMVDLGLKQATEKLSDNSEEIRFLPPKDMPNNTFTYSISSMGQWYRVTIKIHDKIIELRDSLKLLPFSVRKIGKSFGTKHKKLEMEYTGFRYAGCEITPDEQEYIKNDILVVKEALEIMFTEGHKKLTIGSCCLAEYKKSVGGKTYKKYFPQLYDIPISSNYGEKTAGDYIHNSYHGGWCYLAKGKERRIYPQGTTADVNSLYPSMMSSESGNMYPIGEPTFWKGNYIPDEAVDGVHYYFVRFKTRFYLKPGMLPFIQIKNTLSYRATEMLETSDRYNKDDGKYYTQYYDIDGNLQEAIVTLTMTMIDFKLFVEHYELVDFEILDGCYFNAAVGIFDEYIEKYKQIKIHSKGAQRELAKLFLNNLYGKMASSQQSNFKVAYIKEDKTIGFYTQLANDKEAGYIAVGSAITSYARNFTIRAAQQNYYGADKDGFIYADTDSIHCSLPPDQIKGIKIHPTDFCCWKLESTWDVGFFVRQKTYVEHVIAEDCEPIEKPYYNFKCAGMPERCKELFIKSMKGEQPQGEERDKYTKEELQFLETKRTINDFNIGLKVPGKLLPKRIRGGVLLVDTTYEMR